VLLAEGEGPRGARLAAAAATARGDVLLFLHADTRLPAGWRELVEAAVARGASSGAFRLAFDGGGAPMALVAFWANVRTALTRVPYGDQAPFVVRGSTSGSAATAPGRSSRTSTSPPTEKGRANRDPPFKGADLAPAVSREGDRQDAPPEQVDPPPLSPRRGPGGPRPPLPELADRGVRRSGVPDDRAESLPVEKLRMAGDEVVVSSPTYEYPSRS